EAEYLCDEIAIINQGKIIATDTPTGLKQKYGGAKSIEIKLRNDLATDAIRHIKDVADSSAIDISSLDTFRIRSPDAQELLVKVIDRLAKNSILIQSATVNPVSLEDVFLSVIKGCK